MNPSLNSGESEAKLFRILNRTILFLVVLVYAIDFSLIIHQFFLDTKKTLLKRISQLLLSLAIIWLLMFQILHLITNLLSNSRQLAAFIDASGIGTGQFYYTGVENVAHAESNTMEFIFFVKHQQ